MSFLMLGSLLSLGYALAFQFLAPGEAGSLTYWCGYSLLLRGIRTRPDAV